MRPTTASISTFSLWEISDVCFDLSLRFRVLAPRYWWRFFYINPADGDELIINSIRIFGSSCLCHAHLREIAFDYVFAPVAIAAVENRCVFRNLCNSSTIVFNFIFLTSVTCRLKCLQYSLLQILYCNYAQGRVKIETFFILSFLAFTTAQCYTFIAYLRKVEQSYNIY